MRKGLEAAQREFSEGIRSTTCPLVVNDSVRVLGRRDGGAALISLERLEPELAFLVEFGEDGTDQVCSASDLRVASVHGGMTVNERLYAGGMTAVFDKAVRQRDRGAMVRILRLLDVDPPESTVDPILRDPGRYGYSSP